MYFEKIKQAGIREKKIEKPGFFKNGDNRNVGIATIENKPPDRLISSSKNPKKFTHLYQLEKYFK